MNSIFLNIKEFLTNKSTLLWGSIILATLLLTGGLYFLSPNSQTVEPVTEADPQVLTIQPGDWVRGNPETAKAILVEYSDFQCPACGIYFSVLRQLEADMGNDVAIVYRHFPLSAIHPNANLAARAAEAAGLQGKFFEMHDMLFTDQKLWSGDKNAENVFLGYAQKLELDTERFKNDLDSDAVKDKVNTNVAEGKKLGIRGTPTFYLNGVQMPPAKSYAEFKTAITNKVYTQQP